MTANPRRNLVERVRNRLKRQVLRPRMEERKPSLQTIADIFGDSWKSRLPDVESSGTANMFDDPRIAWLNQVLPDGLQGRSVCEIGPFEGYQTFDLSKAGVSDLMAVEANSFNYLKCLCLKEMYGINAHFLLGDGLAYLQGTEKQFDLITASGILYHLRDPVEFLQAAMAKTDHLYIWSHYFDGDRIAENREVARHFVPSLNKEVSVAGTKVHLHARSYRKRGYPHRVPLYWEGGIQDICYWLEKDQMLDVLREGGFSEITIHAEAELDGMPVISLLASKNSAGRN